jgi:ribosome-associated protein
MSTAPRYTIPENEVTLTAIRAQGAGGQNVNKVSSAIHLQFDIMASSLPEAVKERMMGLRDHRITRDGIVVIKAQVHRAQEQNRIDALERLYELLARASVIPRVRRPTKPTHGSRIRRLDGKSRRGQIKALRTRIDD